MSIKVVFCGYRSWALNTIDALYGYGNIEIVDIIKTEDEYKQRILNFDDKKIDCIIFLGWSWIIKDETLDKYLCIGIHPSDLPMYRGGSPIQHQIINGVFKSKITLMTLSKTGIDTGDIWYKEDFDLLGNNMNQIFKNLEKSSICLLKKFFDNYETVNPYPQNVIKGSYYKRRKPEESKLSLNDINTMSLKDLFNFIRALTDPYPNAYLEDEQGNKLLFKEVEYVSCKEEDE